MTMHVLYVLGQDSGGLPHYTAELANAVAAHADVTVLKPAESSADDLFAPEVEVVDAFSPLGISLPAIYRREVHPLSVVRGIRSYDAVKRIREIDPDVVHEAADLFPHVKFYLRRHGIDRAYPTVVTRHEVEQNRFTLERPHHLAEELVDLAIPDLDVDRTVVHTENQKRALAARGVPAEEIAVFPHGTYSVFGSDEDFDAPPEEHTLLFFGHVVPHKGIETLVRAIPLVAEEVPDVTLLVAGDGRIPDSVADIVADHPERFEVTDGYVPNDEVASVFERASVVALPYHEREGGTNGHSGVLATALSFGKPVVASRAGDFPDMVAGEGCGRVVPSRDPEALADALVDVLRDDEARAEMARRSKRLGESLSWDAIGRRHVDLYRELLDDHGNGIESPVRAGTPGTVSER